MDIKQKAAPAVGLILACLAIAALFVVEQVVRPGYAVKSLAKLLCFAGVILCYALLTGKTAAELIRLRPLRRAKPLLLCILACLAGLALLFLLLKDRLDLAGIRDSLMAKEGLTRQNCLFVFAYIIFVNSFLEEAFFRGFLFQLFRSRPLGAVVSALLFAVYHIGIVAAWFTPLLFLLCIGGLAVVGLALQWLSDRYDSIAASWIVHGSANVAINGIGALLIFGLLP